MARLGLRLIDGIFVRMGEVSPVAKREKAYLVSAEDVVNLAECSADFLLTAMEAMGKDDVPIRLKSQPFSDNTIHILTTAQARNITIALVALPVLAVLAVGLTVLIRRKFA